MCKNPSFEIAKKFVEDYKESIAIDFINASNQLTSISKSNLLYNNYKSDCNVSFVESDSLTRTHFTQGENVFINKTRITTIHKLNLDYNNTFYDSWVWGFYNSTKDNPTIRKEDCLFFDFIKDQLPKSENEHFPRIGTPRTTAFELLDIVYTNNRKTIQEQYTKRLFNGIEPPPSDTDTKLLLVSALFNFMLNESRQDEQSLSLDIERFKNIYEFDLYYYSMTTLNDLRKSHFQSDTSFALHIVNSNVFPKELNIKDTANKLFENYEKVYNDYIESLYANNNINHIHNFIASNRDLIIEELYNRILSLVHIIEMCREHLWGTNDPDIIF